MRIFNEERRMAEILLNKEAGIVTPAWQIMDGIQAKVRYVKTGLRRSTLSR